MRQPLQQVLCKSPIAMQCNAMLKTADPMSIFNAACMAATLNLPLQNGLGFAYIVPFRNNKEKKTEAQFQIGYKGFIQLAQRSGQFKRLVALPVYKKQLIKKDFINGFEFDWEQEPEQNENPIGYYAYFKLVNDFSAELYMSHDDIVKHAQRYSQTFKKGYGVWHDNFEAMALKTVTKLLLSKQAPLSVEMQQAVLADQAVVKDVENQEFNYTDNIQEAEFLAVVDEATFKQCKQSIANGETTLQELCDSGAYEFSQEQLTKLEELENQKAE
ncbi:TPA: recombinase RecT [Haemophilus influenzae]